MSIQIERCAAAHYGLRCEREAGHGGRHQATFATTNGVHWEERVARGKLGKRPKKFDARTLQFARYLRRLPTPPSRIDHASRLPADVGMMANDTYGDCTIAAAAHCVQSWTLYAERGMMTLSDAQVVAAYKAISPNDDGAAMLDALNYWRHTGIGPDQIEAFAEIPAGDLAYAKLAIQYFGSAYIGMALPDENTFGPWLTPTGKPNPYNGHAVNLCAFDDVTALFRVMTWGEVWNMSYAWYQRYADEGYAVLNDIALLVASGKSPEGFDYVTLQDDLAHIGDPIVAPAPIPAPPPTPTPAPLRSISVVRSGATYIVKGPSGAETRHTEEREAVEKAVNILLAGGATSVTIVPGFTLTVKKGS